MTKRKYANQLCRRDRVNNEPCSPEVKRRLSNSSSSSNDHACLSDTIHGVVNPWEFEEIQQSSSVSKVSGNADIQLVADLLAMEARNPISANITDTFSDQDEPPSSMDDISVSSTSPDASVTAMVEKETGNTNDPSPSTVLNSVPLHEAMIDAESVEDCAGTHCSSGVGKTSTTTSSCGRIQFSVGDIAMVDMITHCNNAGVSLTFLDELMRIIKKHQKKGFDLSKAPSRRNFMERLHELVPHTKVIPTLTPSGSAIVPKFSLLDQLLDLLSTEYFQSTDQCCVNKSNDPLITFQKYVCPEGESPFDEVLGANWYKRTYDEKIGHQNVFVDHVSGETYINWLVPIVFYNDKTGASAMEGSYSLEPLMFTLGILRRHCREDKEAWRHLGFLPCKYEQSYDSKVSAEEALSRYHECLSVLLSDLKDLQKKPPLLSIELYGLGKVNVRPILEVAYVMGDQLSQDHHCGRKKNNGGGASRCHRRCFTSSLSACCGKTSCECQPVSKMTIDRLCKIIQNGENEKEVVQIIEDLHPTLETPSSRPDKHLNSALKEIKSAQKETYQFIKLRAKIARNILEKLYGMYPVQNAWSEVSFGSNPDGIYSASLDDSMHYNASGLFKYLAEVIFGMLQPDEAKELEKIMRNDFRARSTKRYELPRGKFSPGFTNCTLLTASEKVGLMYAVYLSLEKRQVAEILNKSIKRQQQQYLNMSAVHSALGIEDSSSSPPTTEKLPQRRDIFFFPQELEGMDRSRHSLKSIVDHLDHLGLLFVVATDPATKQLDQLQVEYLLRAVWPRTKAEKKLKLTEIAIPRLAVPDGISKEVMVRRAVKKDLVLMLHRNIRRGCPEFSYPRSNKTSQAKKHEQPTSTPPAVSENPDNQKSDSEGEQGEGSNEGTTINPRLAPGKKQGPQVVNKHNVKKPKVKGTGATCSVLTDLNGLRQLLCDALSYYAIIHEWHNLPPDCHNLQRLQEKVQQIMSRICTGIYRGDNSVDMDTCKIHAHFHVISDIREYAAPMNYEASLGERNLKWWAKHISLTARKCGETTFITQTAERVVDQILLNKVQRMIRKQQCPRVSGLKQTANATMCSNLSWSYTRKHCHAQYNLASKQLLLFGRHPSRRNHYKEPILSPADTTSQLIPEQLHKALVGKHGAEGVIQIWKEVKLHENESRRGTFIRAYHQYDSFGSFFDWAHVSTGEGDDNYVPAKILLLYSLDCENFAACWKARPATISDSNKETNISASWGMKLQPHSCLPEIKVVPTSKLLDCANIHENWNCISGHIPNETNLQLGPNQRQVDVMKITETYSRYAWALNVMDPNQWIMQV